MAQEVCVFKSRWRFLKAMLEFAPDEWPGVYVLWQGDEVIYIGSSAEHRSNIRARLFAHLYGQEGDCTSRATHYGWELAMHPDQRAEELLEQFEAESGRLPRCNARR
jgi:hypothetical protein